MLGGKMGNLGKMAFLALLLTGFQNSAALANTLEEIDYSVLTGGSVRITLKTSEPVSDPSSFATDNPARIAIDLPNTKSGLAVKTKTIGSGVARSVTAIEAGDKTRVVINLLDTVPFEISSDGNQILVSINSAAGSASSGGAVGSGATHQIRGVDFRRGEQGVAKVEVTLSDPNVVVDLRRRGHSVVLDFMDTSIGSSQARTLDVTDFATSVKSIQTRPNRNNTRMSIATQGEFEHLAYQANNVYTLEFRSLTKQEKLARQKQQLVYAGDKLSLNFQDIEVRSVLQLLADFTGLNMVVSDTVRGRITLRLKNVPWDQAMDIILKTRGLSQRRTDNVILVAPTEEIAAREKLELESQRQVEELASLHSELIQIKYATAAVLADLLKTEENRLLSERGSVTVDDRTNTLLVQDTSAKLEEINKLIEALDVPVRQVLVESRIVIANDDFARDLGVKFGFNRDYANSPDKLGLIAGGKPGNTAGTAGWAGPTGGIENPADSEMEALMVNLPAVLGGERGGAINFLVGKLGSYLVQLELSAMQAEGKGEIVSSPRVITSDQSKAIILQGQEIPYQEASSSGATSVSFKEAVLKLEVTPHITPDDRIMMKLKVNKDNPDWSRTVLGVPPIDTRQLETSVLVDNGETVVLGGVFERIYSEDQEKIPWFGDLPVLGFAFRQKLSLDQNQELLIFITPKILKESMSLR
jgi:type IV pilus assembly protein PilQ